MKFWAIRQGDALVPADTESAAEFADLPRERQMQVEAKVPRNPRFHRLFFKLCQRIGAGIGQTTEWVERAFKVETGNFEVFRYGGKDHFVLGSIAFHNMDDVAFNAFFNQCCQIMYERWGIDPASVADLLLRGEEDMKR